MIVKTRGIVLHFIKYSESSVVATIYTEALGRQSFLIKGLRGKNTRNKVNLLQPFFLVEMDVYYKENRSLQKLGELRNACPFSTIPYDIRKSTQAIFLAEVLFRSIRECEANKTLFNFLEQSIQMLDILEEGISDFYLNFLCRYTSYLGILPENNYSLSNRFFDMKTGCYVSSQPNYPGSMSEIESEKFNRLLNSSVLTLNDLDFSKKDRQSMLNRLFDYYSIHIESMDHLNSLSVLKELFE